MGNGTGMTSVGGSTNNVALRLHARGTQDIFPMNPIEMVAVRYNVSECMHVILAPLENNTMANSYEHVASEGCNPNISSKVTGGANATSTVVDG